MLTENMYVHVSLIKWMDKFYGWFSWMKFNIIDYLYDQGGSLNLSWKFRCKFNFKVKV
jgi:hypothetical protein